MPKAKLVTRTATTSTVTDDNLNKASALTHAEMDSNLINLRDSSFGIADDSSTVLQVTNDKTITIAGSGTVATALSGDTLTVTGSGITASSTDTLTNKTFDANGTGNSISNIETADIAAGTLVTAAEGIGSNNNDTTIPTSAAVKAYADSVGGGGGASTGDITFTGSTISAPSNADLTLTNSGTGNVDVDSNKIINVTDPTSAQDAATKAYVDAEDANIASDTLTFTNKTFDANGTGNSISNIETADIAAGTLVTAAEGIGSNNNDTTIPTSAAVKAYADSVGGGGGGTITALNNQAENRLVSIGATTTELDGEANLTFDGSTLTLTGSAALDGVTIADNEITTNRSNDNLNISANGTGQVITAANGDYFGPFGSGERNVMYHRDHAAVFGSRSYANKIEQDIKIDSGQSDSSNSNDRWRNYMQVYLDLNGKSSTYNDTLFMGRGPNQFLGVLPSNSATTDSTLGNAVANNNFIFAETTNTGNLTISQMASNTASVEMQANTGSTITFTDARVYNTNAQAYGSGTENIGTLYHLKVNAASGFNSITNEYGIHTPDSMENLIGGVTLQNGDVTTGAITLADNLITTNRSNDDLNISANGTGLVQLAGNGTFLTPTASHNNKNVLYYKNHAQTFGTRSYANFIQQDIKIDSGELDSSSSSDRYRNIMEIRLDLNGKDSTATNPPIQRGPINLLTARAYNSGSTDSTLGNACGINNFVSAETTGTGDLTISVAASNAGSIEAVAASGTTVTFTDARVFNSLAQAGGAGTNNITNLYHFKANNSSGYNITNEYGVHTPDDMQSLIGGVTLQNGDVTTGAVSITDNLITSNRSNDNLDIEANGTGRVNISSPLEDSSLYSGFFGNASRVKGSALVYEDLSVDPDTLTDREYGHAVFQGTRLTNSSTNSNFRPRALVVGSSVDLDGFSYTNTSNFRGPLAGMFIGVASNTSGTNATINTVRAVETSAAINDFSNAAGDITVVDSIGNFNENFVERNGTGDANITNAIQFLAKSSGYHEGSGAIAITNRYGYKYEDHTGAGTVTNSYAFYDNANALSRFGAVILANQSGDPSGVADSAHIYAKDVASSSEVFVRDEAGNVTQISPHNEQGEWQYWSENIKTGKKVRINMERMIRKLEEITGETFIESE